VIIAVSRGGSVGLVLNGEIQGFDGGGDAGDGAESRLDDDLADATLERRGGDSPASSSSKPAFFNRLPDCNQPVVVNANITTAASRIDLSRV